MLRYPFAVETWRLISTCLIPNFSVPLPEVIGSGVVAVVGLGSVDAVPPPPVNSATK